MFGVGEDTVVSQLRIVLMGDAVIGLMAGSESVALPMTPSNHESGVNSRYRTRGSIWTGVQ